MIWFLILLIALLLMGSIVVNFIAGVIHGALVVVGVVFALIGCIVIKIIR